MLDIGGRNLPREGCVCGLAKICLMKSSMLAGSGLLGLLGRAASGALGATASSTGAPGPRPPGTPTAEPVHGARQARLSLNSRKRQLSVDNLLAHGDAARPRAER